MTYKVEYLIIIKDSKTFCSDIKSFNNLLQSNSEILIHEDKIIFRDITFEYDVKSNVVEARNQRYFKLTFGINKDSEIAELISLLKSVKELIYKAGAHLNVIWDDVSNYYSVKAYPEINKIENLLRKLITTFMLINFGIEWTKEATPLELKNITKKRHNSTSNEESNFLHDTDFIQLADFLFKPYSIKDVSLLFKEIKSWKENSDINLDNLNSFIPRSNWERYFKSYVNFEDEFLNKKWNSLYEYRCLIAHNNFLTKSNYEEILKLVKELQEKFEQAILNIEKVIVPEDEQNKVLENAIKTQYGNFDSFLKIWDTVTYEVEKLYKSHNFELPADYRVRDLIKVLADENLLEKNFVEKLTVFGNYRNKIIENPESTNEKELKEMTQKFDDFHFIEVLLNEDFQVKN